MPSSITQSASPLFIGLQSYTEAQAAQFFGRNDEIDRLTNLIKANTLTIVFGKSGTGKTSLLNAGVFPRLRKDYCLPFRIRLEFNDDSPSLVSQIKHVLKTEIDKYGFTVESYPGEETLWEYFHKEQLWRSITPILIFDQFEEIFTLAKRSTRFTKTEVDAFWEELADLVENSIPDRLKERFLNDQESIGYSYKVSKIKAVFSFREEFLPEFESITSRIPSLKYSRFRLLSMNGHQAYEVITKTWGASIDTAQAQKVVGFFSAGGEEQQAYELMTVEPSLLSQVCSLIEKERLNEGKDKISAEFLDRYSKVFILRSIYDEAMSESNSAVKTASGLAAEKPVNLFVEDKLITDEGYRTKYSLSEQDKIIHPGIAVLKTKYFVREEGKSIELTHDVLTPMIKDDREERRKELALAAAKKKTRRRVMVITAVALLAALGFWYFTAGKAIEQKKEAIHQKEEAIHQKEEVEKETGVLTVKLHAIDSTIKQKTEILKAVETGRPGAADSVLRLQFIEKIRRDSFQISALTQEMTTQRIEWERRDSVNRTQKSVYTVTQRQLDSAIRATQATLSAQSAQAAQAAQMEIASLNSRLQQLQRSYDELKASRQTPSKEKTDVPDKKTDPPETVPDPPSTEPADNNSLKVTLFYKNPKKTVESNLTLYLIPNTPANKSVINSASDYEIRCDESVLSKAKDRKIAKWVNGTYVFFDVPPGNYFVKVCGIQYGSSGKVTKKGVGNENMRLEAAPVQ